MKPNKACPVVTRNIAGGRAVLAFRHPLAGCQLVKGTINEGEDPAAAAIRELHEEAGVTARVIRNLGLWIANHKEQVWSCHLCLPLEELPQMWRHRCHDDGGHDFQFFWQSLDDEPGPEWHPVHRRALAFVRAALTTPSTDAHLQAR
jgi:8-oxo-dGTP pyrophosphatase MutT (NUDIX family)